MSTPTTDQRWAFRVLPIRTPFVINDMTMEPARQILAKPDGQSVVDTFEARQFDMAS